MKIRPSKILVAIVVAIAALATVAPQPVSAHTKSISYSSWVLGDAGASVRVRISLLELSRLGYVVNGTADATKISSYLGERLLMLSQGGVCDATGAPMQITAPEGWVHFEWRVGCPSVEEISIQSSLLLDVAPGHLHFARVRAEGMPTIERVLSAREQSFAINQVAGGGSAQGTSIAGYLVIGVDHILSGWDHLAFLLALLLLAGSVGEVARLITGFTIAHSVTLALAVLGVLNPESAPIEALIGFSIALVAAENAWLMSGRGMAIPAITIVGIAAMSIAALFGVGVISSLTLFGLALFTACHFGLLATVENPRNLRVAVAFAFGLIHGFGFAGVLSELSLPPERLASALFGFNLGVELGQLGVVLLVWPILLGLRRLNEGRAYTLVADVGSAAVCGLGLFWFLARTFS